MRTFVAVDFNTELKKEILKLQTQLRNLAVSGRWKYIDNFHLTLKFLGEIEKSKVQDIKKGLDEVCGKTQKFCLNIDGLDFFPGNGCLRVLWLKLAGELESLHSLQSEIDIMLEKLGFEKEKRRYVPHVTIAQDVVFNKDLKKLKVLLETIGLQQLKFRALIFLKASK